MRNQWKFLGVAILIVALALFGFFKLASSGKPDKKIFFIEDLSEGVVFYADTVSKSSTGKVFIYTIPCTVKKGTQTLIKNEDNAFFLNVTDDPFVPYDGPFYIHTVPGTGTKRALSWPDSLPGQDKETTVQ